MWILLLEVGVALGLLVLLVWWTMYHGRSKPRRKRRNHDNQDNQD